MIFLLEKNWFSSAVTLVSSSCRDGAVVAVVPACRGSTVVVGGDSGVVGAGGGGEGNGLLVFSS